MRRPHVASAESLRKKWRKKQLGRRPRSTSAKAAALRNDEFEMVPPEPMRCVFGAVRAGALLGRLRLHLQTDRFLAVHRSDALWEEACREAGLALAEIVAGMQESALGARLGQAVIPSPPPGAKVISAANVIPWNELRGASTAIGSFRASTRADEGSAVAVHDGRTADSSSSAKDGLLGMTIPATRSAR